MANDLIRRFDFSSLRNPQVKAWALWLISHREAEFRQRGVEPSKTVRDAIADLRGGVEHPERFEDDETGHGTTMRGAFITLYREVIQAGGDGFRVEQQPFFLRLFSEDARPEQALDRKRGLRRKPPRPRGAFSLFRAHPDIERSVGTLIRRMERFMEDRRVVGDEVRGYLEALRGRLEGLDDGTWTDPTEARGEIEAITSNLETLEEFLTGTDRVAGSAVVSVIEMFLVHRPSLPAGEGKAALDDLYRQITGGGGERTMDVRMRNLAAQLFVALVGQLEVLAQGATARPVSGGPDDSTGSPEWEPEEEDTPSIADRIAGGEDPQAVWADILDVQVNPAILGAEILQGVFRRRLGGNLPLLAVLSPELNRLAWIDQNPAGVSFDDPRTVTTRGERTVSIMRSVREAGAPVYVELGGGATPAGIGLARRHPDAWVLSVDPQLAPIRWDLVGAGREPETFVPLAMRAEELALFAAAGPFADAVVAVAPTQAQLMAMLLSAVVLIRPGGHISIYQGEGDEVPAEILRALGLEWTGTVLGPQDGSRPPSEALQGKPMRRVEIIGGAPFATRPLRPTGTDGKPGFSGLVFEAEGETTSTSGPAPDDPTESTPDVVSLGAAALGQTELPAIMIPAQALMAVGR